MGDPQDLGGRHQARELTLPEVVGLERQAEEVFPAVEHSFANTRP